ncbi:hypothetical protein Trydic_g9094 [Trypoxylus dichotomus]
MANLERTERIPQLGSSVNYKSYTFRKIYPKDSEGGKNSLTTSITPKLDQYEKQLMYIAIYNARTLSTEDKLEENVQKTRLSTIRRTCPPSCKKREHASLY